MQAEIVFVNGFTKIHKNRYRYATHIIKLTQTGINRNKYTFCIMEVPQKIKNSLVPYLGLIL